jgi:OmpA family protein
LRVGINAVDGLTIDPNTGIVTPANASFAKQAAGVMAMPNVADRVREVNDNWHWTDADGFRARYEQMAEHAWGERHYFINNTWDDVFSDVEVDLQVHLGGQANDHCTATIFKTPDHSFAGPGAVVNSTGNPTGNTGTFTSSGLEGTTDFLNYRLLYPEGGAAVAQGTGSGQQGKGDPGPAFLDKFIVDFQRGTPTGGASVTVTGHASATGDHATNERTARDRAQNVADYLRANGKQIANSRIIVEAKGDEAATPDAEWRRVDIMVGDGQAQVTMMHETGHMFGLDDEYASPAGGFAPGAGTPGNIGDPVAHTGLAAAMGNGVAPAVSENNDNIMSVGNVIRPQHYATFHEALTNVTAPQGWHYGGAGLAPKAGIPDLIGPDVAQPATATV